MATPLNKPVEREVSTLRGETLVVRLERDGISFRYPRQRRTSAFLLPYGVAFVRAAFLKAEQDRRKKAADRKARKLARAR